jgi:hypothetical protein
MAFCRKLSIYKRPGERGDGEEERIEWVTGGGVQLESLNPIILMGLQIFQNMNQEFVKGGKT